MAFLFIYIFILNTHAVSHARWSCADFPLRLGETRAPAGISPSAKISTLPKDLFIFPLVELFLPNTFYNYRVPRDKAKRKDMGRQAQLRLNIAQMISCVEREFELG